jgi:hypothetical protein
MDCPLCSTSIPVSAITPQGPSSCTGCGAPLRLEVFPRILRGLAPGEPPAAVRDDDASCYVHLGNRAARPCSSCGRYMCTLCDIEIDGRNVCPACLEAGHADSERLVHERTLWGRIVVSMSILPLLIFYVTVFTAPAAVVLAVVKRRAPTSLVRPSRLNLWLGASFAALQIVGWIALFSALVVALAEA